MLGAGFKSRNVGWNLACHQFVEILISLNLIALRDLTKSLIFLLNSKHSTWLGSKDNFLIFETGTRMVISCQTEKPPARGIKPGALRGGHGGTT